MNLGWQEILLILLIALILFGAKRIPEIAKSLGRGVREFKKGLNDVNETPDDDEKKKPEEK
jgi:sec-independent protein translocase protein TatA